MRPVTIAAVVVSAIALAIPILVPVAVVLAVLSLRRAPAGLKERMVARSALGLAALSLAGWGTVLLLNHRRVDAHRGSADCEAGLQALLLAQERFRAGRGRYAASSELGFAPPKSAAKFFQEPEGAGASRLTGLGVGRTGQCPDCRLVLACESGGDWWTIASFERSAAGATTPAGAPRRD